MMAPFDMKSGMVMEVRCFFRFGSIYFRHEIGIVTDSIVVSFVWIVCLTQCTSKWTILAKNWSVILRPCLLIQILLLLEGGRMEMYTMESSRTTKGMVR
jgi:hypothetical protein